MLMDVVGLSVCKRKFNEDKFKYKVVANTPSISK